MIEKIDTLKALLEKRIDQMFLDVKIAHFSRIKEGMEKGYVDENQAMVLIDHLYRIRCYREILLMIENEKDG